MQPKGSGDRVRRRKKRTREDNSLPLIDIFDGPAPKRGDLIQSNVGDRRERTWFVLRVHKVRRSAGDTPIGSVVPRFDIWWARWWELEPDMRMRLFRSAERAGGQNVIFFQRYPSKKRRSLTSPFPLR
jgi:hypothetical protein